MFQILTQEGWSAPLDGVLEIIGEDPTFKTKLFRIVVGLYFILFHLFCVMVSKGTWNENLIE